MSGGYVYVIEFGNGTVKVGHTQAIANRLRTHKQVARSFGLAVRRCWESPCHDGWLANERALMRLARELGGVPTTPEYFNGVSFDALAEKARELPFPAPAAAREVTGADALEPAAESAPGSAVRLAALEAKAAKDRWKAQVACMFLDGGVTPEVMRHRMGRPHVASVMEAVIREEAEIRRKAA